MKLHAPRTAFGNGFPKGYEAQINSSHSDPVRTGSLYTFAKVMDKLVPPDTWFTQEVIADGNHIIIKVNDKVTVDYVDTKNTYMKGHFAFQQHNLGREVWIKNVMVKELPKNQQEVVRLRFMHHHSYQEISDITGLSVGNVGFLLNAAMRNLRGKLERDDKDEKIIYLTKIAS